MKNRLLSLLALLAIMLVGCGDDSTTNATPSGPMAAKVDGGAWTPTMVQPQNAGGNLIIVGTEISGSNTRQINLTIRSAAVGEQTLGGINSATGTTLSYAEGTGSTSGVTLKTYNATSGTVKITELTATGAKGTFSATVEGASGTTGTRSISEGSFNVTF